MLIIRKHLRLSRFIVHTALIVYLVLLSGLSRATADTLELIPSIGLQGEYNDNIFFTVEEESLDDFITTISPGLALIEGSERLDASLTGRLGILRYAENDELDAVDQEYVGQLGYRLTTRWQINASGAYIEDHRPDRDVPATGLVLTAETRDRYAAGLSVSYMTSENTADTLAYRYEKTDFENRRFNDSKIHSINFGHTWHLGRFFRETTGRLNLGYVSADFETSDVDSVSGTAGAEFLISKLWRIVFDLGVRYTQTDFETLDTSNPSSPAIDHESTNNWNGVAEAGLKYDGEYTVANFDFLHDIRTADGRGGTAVRTKLNARIRRRFTEKFSGFLSASAFRNETDQGTVALRDIDEYTFRIKPGIQYDITKDIAFEAAYVYSFIDDRERDRDRTQNRIFAEINWQYPLFE